jgi:hypothetical protein
MGETPPTRIDRMVTDYYDRASEEARLEQALLVEQDLRDGQHRNPTERLGLLHDVASRMAHAHRRAALLRVAQRVEAAPAVLGRSTHLLAVVQRPT